MLEASKRPGPSSCLQDDKPDSKYIFPTPAMRTSQTASDFAYGFRAYHTAFNGLCESAMNYETLPEYQASTYIMHVPLDQHWPYTSHFRKVLALSISDLFKTKITALGSHSVSTCQLLIFMDDHLNRWAVLLVHMEDSASDTKLNRRFMYFPRSKTPTGH